MSKSKYLKKNLLLFTIGSLFPKFISFFLVPFYTGILTTAEYGLIDIVNTTVGLCLPIFTLNVSGAVMRFTLEDKDNKEYFDISFFIICCANILVGGLLLASGLISGIKYIHELRIWIFLVFITNSFYDLYQYYLRAIDKTKLMIIASCLNSFLVVILNILTLAIFKWGMKGYLVSGVISTTCALMVMISGTSLAFPKIPDCISVNTTGKQLLKYSIPTVFTALAWWINSSLDRYFVTSICGESQNGVYSIAYKIPNILGIFQNIFVQAWTLSAIVDFDKDDRDGFFGKTYDIYNSLMVITCSGLILSNRILSGFLYSKEFYEAWRYVPLLLVSSLFSALNGYIGSIFSAVKETKVTAYSTIISAMVNIVLNMRLIPRYGVTGAAVATLIAYLAAWIMRFAISRKYIHMKNQFIREILAYTLLFIQMTLSLKDEGYHYFQIMLFAFEFVVLYKCFVPEVLSKIQILTKLRDRSKNDE